MPPLSDAELDRLERFLHAPERAETAMPLDMVQGFLAAIASGRNPPPQERWLDEILGAAFPSDEEGRATASLLARLAEDTAAQLNEGEGFDFILYGAEGEEDFATWAEGYLAGVDIAEPPWDEEADAEDLDNLLFPFLALTGQAKDMAIAAGESWMGEDEEHEMLADIREGLAQHLLDVRSYWFEKSIPATVRRGEPKVGRNDPCPCGSGRKYKSCHGR